MKRKDFFIKATAGIVGASLMPIIGKAEIDNDSQGRSDNDKWFQMGSGKVGIPKRKKTLNFDVAVIGGGMAGISAAVSAARNGANTILVQDRPVLGGNASSEIRVTVNGVQNLRNSHINERETGIIEEILIENWRYNPQESYPVWDHVLYNYVARQRNLTLLLNTHATEAVMDGNSIKSAICWQFTTETEYTIDAKQFIDCSGDGLLAATAGAEYRTGREGKDEFNEIYAPDKPDGWVMGECMMMITKKMKNPVKFFPPEYAIKIDDPEKFFKYRKISNITEGFWWIEVGSDFDIIGDRNEIHHKLMAYFYGVWDYVKNSGKFPEAESIALDWIGSLPGRRESRRFMGDYILSESDLTGYRHFDDAVAYGGWSLDEHNPGGIEDTSERPSYFHAHFKQPYEIPYRCLYSKNIDNLSFAGRNVSVTHIALSSTRIIGTCAMMGQAVGTAAAMCIKRNVSPRNLGKKHILELQEQLLRDDAYIPNRPANDEKDLAKSAREMIATSTVSGDIKLLTDGVSRDEVNEKHHWEADGKKASIQLVWEKPVLISKVELKGDTNLQRKIMMHKDPAKNPEQINEIPPELVKDLSVEALIDGKWMEVAKVEDNITRLVKTKFSQVKTTAIKVIIHDTWGHKNVKLFEIRCYSL